MLLARSIVLVSFLVLACDASAPGGPDGGAALVGDGPPCTDPNAEPTYEWIVDNVFATSCAFAACHDADQPAGDLALTGAAAYDALVDAAATTQPGFIRVVPGDAQASFLMIALGAAPGPLPPAGPMPLSSPPLCQERVGAIAEWIAAGAPRN